MNRRLTGVLALALAVLAGCQGGDAEESTVVPTLYATAEGDDKHPVRAVAQDPLARAAEEELERLVNDYRIERALPGLRIDLALKELALAHAVHMGSHEPAFFDHVNPEGELPETRATGRIESFTTIGENIAAGQAVAHAVYQSWLASPSHRANLDDPRWTHMGAGHAVLPDSPYVTYWTLNFVERR
jgi:uncharacterized protein YkwD